MKLINKKQIEKRICYDITVDKTNCFFAEGILVHNSNGSIVLLKSGEIQYQSRENVLSLLKDNAGFCLTMSAKKLDFLFEEIEFSERIEIFGEWSGKGIQTNMAINQLPKMFIIFGCKVDGVWKEFFRHDNSQLIYHIDQFPNYEIDIDFNDPLASQNKLIEMTLEVEKECPVGKQLGATIENGSMLGEGIVFSCVHENSHYVFKSKGELHSAKSKVNTLKPVDEEARNKAKEIAIKVCPEWRLEQMAESTFDFMNGGRTEKSKIGIFIKNMMSDIAKEESDVLVENQVSMKEIASFVAEIVKKYFFELENKEI